VETKLRALIRRIGIGARHAFAANCFGVGTGAAKGSRESEPRSYWV
jgi:hypothetical protein